MEVNNPLDTENVVAENTVFLPALHETIPCLLTIVELSFYAILDETQHDEQCFEHILIAIKQQCTFVRQAMMNALFC